MPTGVYLRTKEHIKILKKSHKGQIPWIKGKKLSENKRKIMGEKIKLAWEEGRMKGMCGKIPWNKGKKVGNNLLGKHWKIKDSSRMGVKGNQNGFKKGQTPWNKGLKGFRSGEKSNFWKGGISFELYPIDWTETLRRSIRERDKYICQLCGKIQIQELEEIERKLCIHHIDYNKKNCCPDNLTTLCHSCNVKVNFNRDYWTDYFDNLSLLK